MANATTAISTPRRISFNDMELEPVVNSGVTLYAGAMGAINTDGELDKAAAANTQFVVGRIKRFPKGSSLVGDGAKRARVEQGIFRWTNSTNATISDAAIGKTCFAEDDTTVALTGTLRAGIVIDVDTNGVWVLMGLGSSGAGALALNATMPTGALL